MLYHSCSFVLMCLLLVQQQHGAYKAVVRNTLPFSVGSHILNGPSSMIFSELWYKSCVTEVPLGLEIPLSLHSEKLWCRSRLLVLQKKLLWRSVTKCDGYAYLESTQTRLPISPAHGQASPPHSFIVFWVSICQWTWSSVIQLASLAGQWQSSCLVHPSAGVTGAHV